MATRQGAVPSSPGAAPEERAAFVAAAAENDEELRREVESAAAGRRSGFSVLDRLPLADAAVIAAGFSDCPGEPTEVLSNPSQRGHRIGPYEIAALLGAGAMGQVYRARDRKLNRDVA